MTNTVKAIPEGFHSLTPSLTCKDASKAIDFYKNVFGAKELGRMAGPDGKIMHADLQIGDSHIFINDEMPGMLMAPTSGSGKPVYLVLYTEDVDSMYQRALSEGSQEVMPLQDQFWGDRYGKLVDPFGHEWGLAQHVEDVRPEEMKTRMEAAMSARKAQSAG